MFNMILDVTEKDLNNVVEPLLQVLGVAIPVLLGIVGALGSIWVIYLGVKYAKAEDPQEHEKAKSSLKNAIIGFVLIFVLLIALKAGLNLFTDWWRNYNYSVI